MNASSVVKPFHVTMKVIIIFRFKTQVILDRNPMKVFDVAKTLHITVITKYLKEQKVERITMNISNVVKLLDIIIIFKGMKALIL